MASRVALLQVRLHAFSGQQGAIVADTASSDGHIWTSLAANASSCGPRTGSHAVDMKGLLDKVSDSAFCGGALTKATAAGAVVALVGLLYLVVGINGNPEVAVGIVARCRNVKWREVDGSTGRNGRCRQ